MGDDLSGFGLEGEFDVVGLGAIPSLDIFLECENGHLGVEFELWDFEAGEVVLEVDFDKVFDHGR